ncbi:MAG: hypothetical protein DDT18_00377 [Actinobacteria bacterium]|nr:hypothetical protein [Bacillota bacterium]MBT9170039.1 hypothetical protein [Actinomycetota bacterium]
MTSSGRIARFGLFGGTNSAFLSGLRHRESLFSPEAILFLQLKKRDDCHPARGSGSLVYHRLIRRAALMIVILLVAAVLSTTLGHSAQAIAIAVIVKRYESLPGLD